MRFVSLSIACVLSLLLSGCATSSQQKELAKEIQQLRTEIAVLKETIKPPKKIIALSPSSHSSRGQQSEKIAEIGFPGEPTEENLRNYINEILVASLGVTYRSSSDPQVSMLALVGADNLQLLVNAMGEGAHSSAGGYYLNYAIKRLAEDRHKEMILQALPTKQCLVSVVLQKGWEEDAKDTLITELKGANGAYLPTDWVKAVAALQDPETYDALGEYFSKASNASYIYKSIHMLPGIQLNDAVGKAWENAKESTHYYTVGSMAAIAISYGHQDAIEELIDLMKDPPKNMSSSLNPRLSLIMHLGVKGSNEEIIAWYETNKDNLVFDSETKKFKVKE